MGTTLTRLEPFRLFSLGWGILQELVYEGRREPHAILYTNKIQIQMGICRARLTNCPGALTNVRMLCETGEF